MRLADFIEGEMEAILSRWEDFADTLLPAARTLDSLALRDHAEQILRAVAADLRQPQTRAEQEQKSRGQAVSLATFARASGARLARHVKGWDRARAIAPIVGPPWPLPGCDRAVTRVVSRGATPI